MPRQTALAVASAALLATLLLGAGLGGYALYEPDEARHATVAREMLEASSWRDWIVPRIDGVPYRNKPAPFYWAVAASFAGLGVDEGAARLVSAVAGILTVLAVCAWAAARWGPRTAALTGLVLVTAPEFFVLGRFVSADMAVGMWVTIGVLAVHRFARGPGRSLVPAAIAGACGLLTKGALAPALIASTGMAYLAATGRLRLLTPRTLGVAAATFLAVALPWHVVAGTLDPEYLRILFVDQQWKRALDAGARLHARSVAYYVPIILAGFFPWSMLLPATFRTVLSRARRDDAAILCAVWAAAVFVLFSLAQGKVGSYILPIFPPLALLTGRGLGLVLAGVATAPEVGLVRAGLWLVVGVLACLPPVAITAGVLAYEGALLPTSLYSLLLWAPAAALAVLLRRSRVRDSIVLAGAASTVLLLITALLVAPPLMEVHSDAALVRLLGTLPPAYADAPLVAYHLQSPSLRFYLRRRVRLKENPDQLRRLLAEHPAVFVVTSQEHVPELLRAGPFVAWYLGPRRVLYASIPPPEPPAHAP